METKNNVPYGGTIFSAYKISLSIESKYINNENIGVWNNNKNINIRTIGEITEINIYANYYRSTKHLGRKCFNAILFLIKNNVFNEAFIFLFYKSINLNSPLIFYSNFMTVYIIELFFKIIEWEWVFDFYDLPLFSIIDINFNNEKGFKRDFGVNYTQDRENEEHLVFCQQSLVTHYNIGRNINSTRNIERVKILQQGKYRTDLSIDLLDGTKENAITKLLPILKNNVNNVLDKDSFVLNSYWKVNASRYFIEIFQ